MTRDKFIELHGHDTWQKLVEPREQNESTSLIRANQNAIVNEELRRALRILGFEGDAADSVKAARKEIERQTLIKLGFLSDVTLERAQGFILDALAHFRGTDTIDGLFDASTIHALNQEYIKNAARAVVNKEA